MKKILVGLLTIIILFVVFFFWASSSAYDKSTYTNISTYDSSPESYTIGDTLRVMTYNIGYLSGMTNNLAADTDEDFYNNNLERAQQLFEKHRPHIAGFQEIDYASARSYYVNQLDEIGKSTAYHNAAMTVNWDKNYLPFPYWPPSAQYGKMLSGQAILSEFPIESTDRYVMDKPESNPGYYNAFYIDRLAQVTKLNLGKTQLVVINTHLEAWEIEAREKQVRKVLELYNQYASEYPTLLVGDFNSIPAVITDRSDYFSQDHTLEIILSGKNIAPAISDSTYLADPSTYFTFSSAEPDQRIDYIFYNSDRITPVRSRVISEAGDISDHLPVIMDFVINN